MKLNTTPPAEKASLLGRSLRAAWLLAFALAALLLPTRPAAAGALLAGQALAAINFFFLEKIVKLITHSAVSGSARRPLPPTVYAILSAKFLIVYGAALTLVSLRILDVPFLAIGLSLPLIALFLKSVMLAIRPTARVATTIALLALLIAPVVAQAQAHDPAATAGQTTPPPTEQATPPVPHDAAPAQGHEPAKGHEEGPAHLPNWVVILNDYFPNNPVVHWMYENEYLVFAWLAGLVFLAFAWIAMRRATWVPGPLQNALEWMIESMESVCGGMLGKHTDRYFPFIIALFFYVLSMNLIGIIPGFKSSTSSLDVTLALALITFLYVQVIGIRNLGILGYLDHLAGSPRDLVGFIMLPVMIPVHVLGELAKPVSLSCRLFGNIFGEDTLIVVFVGASALLLKASLVALALPPMLGISALFMLLQTLTSIVQALIFALLASVYLYMMLPHEHEHEAVPGAEHAHA
ncbi:MAG TPA: F0F1 ATP synthase subunit A [Candidatus Eisenbacteria bacterium]|nr:F0F1 ATP synthase subunit A [Candidatus Eisenbacteria bacterium]